MQTGPASPEKPPAVEPEAEAKVEGAAEAGEEQGKAEEAVKMEGKEEEGEDEEEEEEERRGGGRRRRRGTVGDGAVVMVKRELLVRCMTCPLCRRLLRDATTISECLHTFCRKCIYKKLNDEEQDHCPVCKIDLGCTPLEKLRADNNLQDVRSKVFPFKRKKINAEEVESPIMLHVKRKERSISSLVVNTPRITPAGLTGRRTRAVTRKAAALRGLGPIIVDPLKKDNDNLNKQTDNSSLLDSLSKIPQTRRQVLSNGDTSSHPSGKDKAGDNKDLDKAELWRPLNCLVEAASKTKPPRTSAQSPAFKVEKPNESPSSEHSSRTKAKEPLQKSKVQDDKKDIPEPIVLLRRRGPGRKRKHPLLSANAASSAAASQNEKTLSPVWFSLIASFDQKGDPPLPQIPAHYLRIKDGSIPASSIQKYIMQKLSLLSESEVEISCCGQSVNPAQPVRNLVERWLRVGPARPLQTMIGSSGGDYVMVISYGRPKSASS
ncbi:E3 ubiquitin protein ligase DRIP2-like [Phragmites australis]|uniref:E3 ubiquitin protein ligase DRIP2-like n=1 Tax=Phragmites australis TaxID=29695 RepID=UPI002D79863C|nr:E3 ubiquitin protein ligase DRIP2-like [Phragmites australis]